jgi:hypothetical protein
VSEPLTERYRGYVLTASPHSWSDGGWFFEWRDTLNRTGDIEPSYARNVGALLADAKRFIDRRIEGELLDVERGLARMG